MSAKVPASPSASSVIAACPIFRPILPVAGTFPGPSFFGMSDVKPNRIKNCRGCVVKVFFGVRLAILDGGHCL
jgi:hypothetical protein